MLAVIRRTTTQKAINRMTFRVPTRESDYTKTFGGKKHQKATYIHRTGECSTGVVYPSHKTIHACLNSFAFDFNIIAMLFVTVGAITPLPHKKPIWGITHSDKWKKDEKKELKIYKTKSNEKEQKNRQQTLNLNECRKFIQSEVKWLVIFLFFFFCWLVVFRLHGNIFMVVLNGFLWLWPMGIFAILVKVCLFLCFGRLVDCVVYGIEERAEITE